MEINQQNNSHKDVIDDSPKDCVPPPLKRESMQRSKLSLLIWIAKI